MDARLFLENFAAIAEAPGGVDRLRELILGLALQGKLVPQDPADGPAGNFLAACVASKGASPAPSMRRRSKSSSVTTVVDPLTLPTSWAEATAADLGQVVRGVTYAKVDASDNAESGKVPLLRAHNIQRSINYDKLVWVPASLVSSNQLLAPGDLLICMSSGSSHLVGKAAPISESRLSAFGAFCSSFRPYLPAGAPYLSIFFQGPTYRAHVAGASRGIGINNLRANDILGLQIPVPPLAEQERIVAKVDELLGLCDDLQVRMDHKHLAAARFRGAALNAFTAAATPDDMRRAWERVSTNWTTLTDRSDNIDDVRRSILQLAVEGHLVAQDPNDHPAKAELQVARTTKAAATGSLRGQPPLPRQADLLESDLPNGWVWAQVDDAFLVTGGIQKTPKRQPHENHYPYLRVANVQRGRLDLREIERFELFDGELDRLRLARGDLLVVEGNGSETEIGRCARWDGQIDDCVHQNHIIRCRPMVPGLEHYLLLFLNSPAGKATMKDLAVTTSGLYNLSVAKIRAIRFPMPPTAEQVRIRRKVDELTKCCDLLESKLAQRQTIATHLAESAVGAIAL